MHVWARIAPQIPGEERPCRRWRAMKRSTIDEADGSHGQNRKSVGKIGRETKPKALELTLFRLLPEHARAIDVADGVVDCVGAAVILNRFAARWHDTIVVHNDVAPWRNLGVQVGKAVHGGFIHITIRP